MTTILEKRVIAFFQTKLKNKQISCSLVSTVDTGGMHYLLFYHQEFHQDLVFCLVGTRGIFLST